MDNPIAELDFVFQKHGGEDIYDKFLEWWVQDYTGGLSVKKKLIYLQVNGSSILNDKEVISRLRLTETEKFDYGVVSAMLSVEKIRITDAWKSVGLTVCHFITNAESSSPLILIVFVFFLRHF